MKAIQEPPLRKWQTSGYAVGDVVAVAYLRGKPTKPDTKRGQRWTLRRIRTMKPAGTGQSRAIVGTVFGERYRLAGNMPLSEAEDHRRKWHALTIVPRVAAKGRKSLAQRDCWNDYVALGMPTWPNKEALIEWVERYMAFARKSDWYPSYLPQPAYERPAARL